MNIDGVTSSGKTFTVYGEKYSPGLALLAVSHVCKIQEEADNESNMKIYLSYLEVYDEVG